MNNNLHVDKIFYRILRLTLIFNTLKKYAYLIILVCLFVVKKKTLTKINLGQRTKFLWLT